MSLAAGEFIRAADIRDAAGLFVRKAASESVTSSAVLQNDDQLFLAVEANTVYFVEGLILYDGATAGDMKVAWTLPAGATFRYRHTGPATGMAGTSGDIDYREINEGDTLGLGAAGAGTTLVLVVQGVLSIGATAGTFRLQWAQFASSGTATRVFAGSLLHAKKLA